MSSSDTSLFFSLLGWFMKRFSWPRPPLILGLVLSGIIENYLFISISRYGATWMMRPIVLIVAVFITVSLYYGFRTARKQKELQQMRDAQIASERDEATDEA